jgi:DegV family protein with EDD domain
MARVRVVTDSAADIPNDVARALHITVVPLSVHFGDHTYVDGEDIDAEAFYKFLRTSAHFPRTSQPPVGLFERAYEQLRDEGMEVVSIHLSAGLSGTFACAGAAAQHVAGLKVRLVDSRLASMAVGTLAITAAKLAEEGKASSEIVEVVENLRDRSHIAIMIDNLAHLERGGRIGRAQSMLGTLMNVKPIVSLEGGVVTPLLRARTTARALQEIAAKARSLAPLEGMHILHSSPPALVDEFRSLLVPSLGSEVPSALLGPVIGTHVGLGAMGLLMIQSEPRSSTR